MLFDAGSYIDGAGTHRMYDLAPDGRFIMVGTGGVVAADDAFEGSELIFVLNWREELKRLVPGS